MDDKNSDATPCPIARSLGIAPTMLTRRLATLMEEGLLEQRFYSECPPREEYRLSAAWGRRYRGDDKLIRFIDVETGSELNPIAVDAATGVRMGFCFALESFK